MARRQYMNQEDTRKMLTAIGWANARMAKLGLPACVVHSFGVARMLSATGLELKVVEDGDGTAESAIVLLVAQFEHGLELLLRGPVSGTK